MDKNTGSDIQDADDCDNMDVDRQDGGNDNDSYGGSLKRLDEKLRNKPGMTSPLTFDIKTEDENDGETDRLIQRKLDEARHARDVHEA